MVWVAVSAASRRFSIMTQTLPTAEHLQQRIQKTFNNSVTSGSTDSSINLLTQYMIYNCFIGNQARGLLLNQIQKNLPHLNEHSCEIAQSKLQNYFLVEVNLYWIIANQAVNIFFHESHC